METYLRRAKAAGIDKTVIFSPFHSNYQQANANTARIVATMPNRFIGFAFAHAQRDKGRIYQIIDEAVNRWKFCGIKVHRMDGPATREVCDAARAFRLPLLYDPAGKTDLIDLLAPQYPDVNFIIPHLGSFADDWRAHLRVIDQISRYPNVYTDTSGIRRFDYLVQAVKCAGAHKVLFGTDGPWLHPGVELQKVHLLGLPPKQEALILGENLLRLIRGVKTSPRTRAGAEYKLA
jgi:predicted TIM-barrel fold metal-dependent hydrolase